MLTPARQTPTLNVERGMAGEDKISCGADPAVLLSHRNPPGLPAVPHWKRLTPTTIDWGVSVAASDFSIGMKCRVCGKLYPKSADQLLHRRLRPARSRLRLRAPSKPHSAARRSRCGREPCGATASCLPLDGEPTVGPQVGGTPAGPRRPTRRRARRRAASGSRTTRSTSRRCRSRTASSPWRCRKAREFGMRTVGCASTGNLANSVAANAAAAGLESVHLRPRRPGADQDSRHHHLRREGHRRHRHLRRGESPLHADRAQVRLGLRQHQPAAVLRRRLEDDGLRDRRATRLAVPAARRLPDGRRQPDRQDSQGVHRTATRRPGRSASDDEDVRRPGRPAATRSPTA